MEISPGFYRNVNNLDLTPMLSFGVFGVTEMLKPNGLKISRRVVRVGLPRFDKALQRLWR